MRVGSAGAPGGGGGERARALTLRAARVPRRRGDPVQGRDVDRLVGMSTSRTSPPRPPSRRPAHAAGGSGTGGTWRLPRSAAARRRRRLVVVAAVVVIGAVAWIAASSGRTPSAPASATHVAKRPDQPRSTAHVGASASLVASMARWRLPNAVSRAGAASLTGNRILLLGGLVGSGASSSDVGVLDTSSGRLTSVATLPSPTHDAGSSVLGGKAFLFGGGQSTPFALVQAVTIPGASTSGAGSGVVTGQLPQARADAEAVTVGGTAYVVGGYDGATGDPAVLATQDGSSFSTVVTLPVDVRYPAVVAAGERIFVFGGESEPGGTTAQYATPTGTTTPPPGQEVAVVQEIDLRTHTAQVVGYLPRAVQGAAAFDLNGHIFLAGGDSNAPGSPPSSGSTIWSFDPSTDAFGVAGHLAAPVAYAAVAVEGHAVWLVGGQRDGVAVATAQKIVLRSRH